MRLLISLFHRETKEECGLDVTDLDKVGIILFEFVGELQLLEVHVFRTKNYFGSIMETEGESIISTTNLSNKIYSFHSPLLQRCFHSGLSVLTFLLEACGLMIICGIHIC